MVIPHRSKISRATGGAVLAGLVILGMALSASPVSAQGLFDFFFGGPRRPGPPPSARSYADPNSPDTRQPEQRPRVESGGSAAYCVRLCDGRYFPIQRSSGGDAAQVCGSFCPASRTKIYSGGGIDHATASDGSRYKDLPNAFVYRDRKVADCTCNGKDTYGLVTTDANNDPTLRPGDIVATEQGFVAYSGGRRNARFTPIESYGGLSAELRKRLAGAKIAPRNATPVTEAADTTATVAGNKRVQAAR